MSAATRLKKSYSEPPCVANACSSCTAHVFSCVSPPDIASVRTLGCSAGGEEGAAGATAEEPPAADDGSAPAPSSSSHPRWPTKGDMSHRSAELSTPCGLVPDAAAALAAAAARR
jgi:hypothetical protein